MKIVIACLFVFALAASPALSKDVYVDAKNRKDTNTGSLESPFRTIQAAADNMVSGDISHIRAGIYRETVIPESDGLTFKNYEGEYVLITGLDVISDWQPYNGGEANGNMQTPSSTKITQVFVDGKRMNWARYPNEDEDMLSTGELDLVNINTEQPTDLVNFTRMESKPDDYWVGACFIGLPTTRNWWTAYFEAENFTSQTGGNKASTEYFPYIGEGYLEMGGLGATVTWNNITVPRSGKYTLLFKYANNTDQELPCDLKVNGALIKNIPFGPFKKNWGVPWPAATEYNSDTVGWAKYWNARVIVDLKAGANTLELIATSEEGGPHIDNIGVSTAVSEPPAPVVNVKDYGAMGDGSTDNTEAIAKAIAACPAGGSVVFDEGVYMSGSITLKSNMTLWVSENAIIRAIQDNDKIQSYPEAAFAGSSFVKNFLFGNQVENLTITGGGTIDGNAVDGYLISNKPFRPVLLGLLNAKNVKVTNLDLLHSHSWLFIPRESDNVIIDGINIYTPHKDGIDPLDCHNIYITNSVISSGDDAMTPKSYSSKGIDNLVVKNLTINFCKWKGIKFGFSSIGDFTNCLFEDIAMVHVQAGITVLLIDGGNASNLTFNRINMNNVFTPITLLNGGGLRSKAPGITTMKDISISNLEARNVWDSQGSFITGTKVGNTIHKVENVYLTNVNVDSFKGGLTTVPDTPIEYDGRKADIRLFGNFPAWAYYIRHADNVVFKNVTHSVSPEDAREDIVLKDVTGFKTLEPGNPSSSRPNNK